MTNIGKLQENTAELCNILPSTWSDPGKRHGGSEHGWPEKLKRSPLPSGCEISGCKMLAYGILDMKCRRTEFRMWNVGARNSSPGRLSYAAQGELSACARCRDSSPGWHGARKAIRINSIRIPQEDMWRAPLSGPPQGKAHGTCEHHIRTIASPIRICCPDHWLPPPSDGVSGHLLLLAFRICLWQRTSKLRFFMFLSFPFLCQGFQRTLLNLWLL